MQRYLGDLSSFVLQKWHPFTKKNFLALPPKKPIPLLTGEKLTPLPIVWLLAHVYKQVYALSVSRNQMRRVTL